MLKKLLFENLLVRTTAFVDSRGRVYHLRYWNYLRTWRHHRGTIKQLNKLTDKELKDIGISRGDINRLIGLKEDKTVRGRGS
jgi:uncharacterized protein YjiS (DUF1127 family)